MYAYKALLSLTAATGVFVLAQAANAQTIDYGSLEMLFDEPVTTSATGKPQRAGDAPVTMEIITAEQIRRSGASDIPEVLRFVIGMSVQRSTLGGVDVGMRGYNGAFNERILVLVNGRQAYLDHFGYIEWASLPVALEEIRQIEVVKGPNTALYGFNATSGVINIITYNPLYDTNVQVTARGGNLDYLEASANFTKKISNRLGVRVSAGGWRSTDFTTHLHHFQENALRDDAKRNFVAGEVIGQVTDNIQAGFEATYSEVDQGELFFDYTFSYSTYESKSFKAFVAAETKAGLTEVKAYRNSTDLVNTSTLAGESQFITIPVDTRVSVASISHLFKVGADHAFRGSVEYRNNVNPTFPANIGELHFKSWSFSGMWDWAVNDKLSFIAAGRYDTLGMTRTGDFLTGLVFDNDDFARQIKEWSLNTGLVYKPTEEDTIRLTMGKGVDLPSATEFGLMKQVAQTVFQIGNPLLKTSRVWNFELGYDHSIEAIDGQFRSALFYYKASNLQNIQQNEQEDLPGGIDVFVAENSLNTRALGFETGLKGKAGENIDWFVNYLFVDVKDTSGEDDGGAEALGRLEAVDFQNNAPKHTLNFGLGYKKDKFSVDLYNSLTSSRRQLRGNRRLVIDDGGDEIEIIELIFVPISTQLKVNGRAAYQVTDNLTVAMEGQGLTQKDFRETSLAKIERRWTISLNYRF
ncbi:MAG: TonB-dependent receptor plug domain-containing protein [Pseudomonadota bacterium]